MYLAFCYNVKPRMMNNILFTKKPNKQKNIETAVIYCIHIPLSQLITTDCTIEEGKWFNIEGNRSIVNRYRLDSQFHCSYLESRGVPEKTREIPSKKTRGKLSPFHFRFTTSGDVISGDATSSDVISGDATSGDVISGDATSGDVTAPHSSTSNDKWMVPLYYWRLITVRVLMWPPNAKLPRSAPVWI